LLVIPAQAGIQLRQCPVFVIRTTLWRYRNNRPTIATGFRPAPE